MSPGMTRSWRPSWPGYGAPLRPSPRRRRCRRSSYSAAARSARLDHDCCPAVERGDGEFKPASLRTFERMAEAVATRAVPRRFLSTAGVRGWVEVGAQGEGVGGGLEAVGGGGTAGCRRCVSVIGRHAEDWSSATPCRSTLGRVHRARGRDRPRWD